MKSETMGQWAANLIIGAAAWMMAVTPLAAQTSDKQDAATAPRVDFALTPFVSIGSSFSSQIGGSIAFALPAEFAIEVEMGYRRQDIGALNVSANLLYDLPRLHKITPYLAAGIGIEQYGVPVETPRFGVVTQRKVGRSTSLGGGLRIPLTNRVDYRSDVRWLNVWGPTPEGWRIYNGASLRTRKR